MIPFLIIFALVLGILSKVDPFKGNKGIYSIIALAVGLMALQFEFVPNFFSKIFPKLGAGLVIILGVMIILGLFLDFDNPAVKYSLLAFSTIIFIIVLINSEFISELGISLEGVRENLFFIIVLIIVFVLILITVGKNKSSKGDIFPMGGHGPRPY